VRTKRFAVATNLGLIAVTLTLVGISIDAQRATNRPNSSAPQPPNRLETPDNLGSLQSEAYRMPCLSANIIGDNPIGVTEREVSNRAELRLRAVGLTPIPFAACGLPDFEAPFATTEQMNSVWLAVEPYFPDGSTFNVEVRIFRVAKWRVGSPTATDDGFRGRLMSINSYKEPTFPSRRLRHDGRGVTVLDAVDRLLDAFLVDYLRANQR
jgi:hypothetical protein